MSPRGQDDVWQAPPAPRPYAPSAPDPGPRVEGLTGDWSEAMAEARRMHEARQAPEPAGPRHARQHAFPGVLARGTAAVLILLGTLLVAAGTAVREWTS